MRFLSVCLLCAAVFSSGEVYAQCYKKNYQQAESLYQQGNYASAKKRFIAAKYCPDKPASANLESRIRDCDAQISEEAARKRRREEAAREEARRREEASRRESVRILNVEFRNEDIDDNVLNDYGETLYASEVCYLMPRISYEGLSGSSREMTFYYKIFGPDGKMRSGSSSPSGYTNSVSFTVYSGRNTKGIGGWGRKTAGSYDAGVYRFEIWQDGKKLYTQNFTLYKKQSGRSGKVESVWVDYDQWQGGNKGMKIHVKFSVDNMLGRKGKCVAYFSFANGDKLKDFNNSYCTVDGQVSLGENFTPSYENALFSDFVMFMPYDELHMAAGSGKTELRFFILIYDAETEEDLAKSDYYNFNFTKGS